MTIGTVAMLYIAPVLYKQFGVSDSVTLLVLGTITTMTTSYLGFNVMQKKAFLNGLTNGDSKAHSRTTVKMESS